jgi:hypothetical protein
VLEIVLETQVKNTQLEGPTPIEVTICRSTSTASLHSMASPTSPHGGGRSPSPSSHPPANTSQFMSPPAGATPAKIGPFSGVVSLFEGKKKTNVSLSEEDTANFSEKAIKSAVRNGSREKKVVISTSTSPAHINSNDSASYFCESSEA